MLFLQVPMNILLSVYKSKWIYDNEQSSNRWVKYCETITRYPLRNSLSVNIITQWYKGK